MGRKEVSASVDGEHGEISSPPPNYRVRGGGGEWLIAERDCAYLRLPSLPFTSVRSALQESHCVVLLVARRARECEISPTDVGAVAGRGEIFFLGRHFFLTGLGDQRGFDVPPRRLQATRLRADFARDHGARSR